MQLMSAECGWIYLSENDILILKHMHGTVNTIIADSCNVYDPSLSWLRSTGVYMAEDEKILNTLNSELQHKPLKILISIPLSRQGIFAGVIVLGSSESLYIADYETCDATGIR